MAAPVPDATPVPGLPAGGPAAPQPSGLPDLRDAMLATSRAILSKQLRTERELGEVRESLRRQNEELTATNAILTATLDATPLGIIACDLHGDVERTNRRLGEIFSLGDPLVPGLGMQELAAVLGRRLIAPDEVRHWLDRVMAEPHQLHAMQVEAPDGRYLSCRAVPQMAGPECVGVVLNWSDITEQMQSARLKAEAEAARQASGAKSAFMSRASHELRTPLNAVVGFSQLLALNPHVTADATAVRQLALIHAAGNHLAALVDDLLQLSRVETGELPLRMEPVDLAACAREVMDLVALSAKDRAVVLDTETPDVAWARGDRTRVRQVLLNLASNAVKYNRPGGSVQLHVRPSELGWAVEVRDTGLGLSMEQQAHLFEPFNRLGAERLKVEGTGLGLTISRHLVLAMKGTLQVSSVSGEGSAFTMSLPAGAPLDGPGLAAP